MDKRDVLQEKKTWSAPTLTVFGSVEELTLGCDKRFGTTDGFTFMGQEIICSS
jgi:hypothetical protein